MSKRGNSISYLKWKKEKLGEQKPLPKYVKDKFNANRIENLKSQNSLLASDLDTYRDNFLLKRNSSALADFC